MRGEKSAQSLAQVQGTRAEHPPGLCPPSSSAKLQTRGGSSGAGEGLRGPHCERSLRSEGCRREPARRKCEEEARQEALGPAAQPQRCPVGLAGPEEVQLHPSSPGQEAGAARRDAGGGRRDALRCKAGAPGWRAQEAGTRVAPGWRREQAERRPGQGQRGKRQGADEIQEEEEVDEDEAGPPAGSGGGGGSGGREKRLAGS